MELEQPQINDVRRLSRIYESVIHKPSKKRKHEIEDLPGKEKEAKIEPKLIKEGSHPLVEKIINDILAHTKRGNDDRLYLENKQQLEVLIDYYVKNKEDTYEPRARDMLKDMFSIPRKDFPTKEQIEEIKKLPKKLGRLIHPDKFSSAPPELVAAIQEIFQFLGSCLDNSGFNRK